MPPEEPAPDEMDFDTTPKEQSEEEIEARFEVESEEESDVGAGSSGDQPKSSAILREPVYPAQRRLGRELMEDFEPVAESETPAGPSEGHAEPAEPAAVQAVEPPAATTSPAAAAAPGGPPTPPPAEAVSAPPPAKRPRRHRPRGKATKSAAPAAAAAAKAQPPETGAKPSAKPAKPRRRRHSPPPAPARPPGQTVRRTAPRSRPVAAGRRREDVDMTMAQPTHRLCHSVCALGQPAPLLWGVTGDPRGDPLRGPSTSSGQARHATPPMSADQHRRPAV